MPGRNQVKRFLIAAGLVLAAGAVHAQERPSLPAPDPMPPVAVDTALHGELAYQSPHRHAAGNRSRRAGDPPVIDHSMDTLVVEPTQSSITILSPEPTPPYSRQ
jgi:hypothetical protein